LFFKKEQNGTRLAELYEIRPGHPKMTNNYWGHWMDSIGEMLT